MGMDSRSRGTERTPQGTPAAASSLPAPELCAALAVSWDRSLEVLALPHLLLPQKAPFQVPFCSSLHPVCSQTPHSCPCLSPCPMRHLGDAACHFLTPASSWCPQHLLPGSWHELDRAPTYLEGNLCHWSLPAPYEVSLQAGIASGCWARQEKLEKETAGWPESTLIPVGLEQGRGQCRLALQLMLPGWRWSPPGWCCGRSGAGRERRSAPALPVANAWESPGCKVPASQGCCCQQPHLAGALGKGRVERPSLRTENAQSA